MFSRKKKLFLYLAFILFFILFFWSAFAQRKSMIALYESGINKIHTQEYAEAQLILGKLGDYKDSLEQIKTAERLEKQSRIYEEAMNLYTQEDFEDAAEKFSQISDFKDSSSYLEKSKKYALQKAEKEKLYIEAVGFYNSGDNISAIQGFSKLSNYEDSEELLLQCKTELAKLQQATTISAGIHSSVGMIKHGKVLLARNDYYSWRTELNTCNDIISVSVKGNFVVGLRENGTVVMAGKVPEFYVGTKTWDRIISISAGQQYIVGLREDGTLVAQGLNSDNQADIDSWHDIVAIATGWRHTVGLNSEGKICITGFRSEEQLKDIEDNKDQWFDIVDIDAGGGSSEGIGTVPYTVALKESGTVVTTLKGEIANKVAEWTDIIAISAGDSHIVGLKSDGTVVTTQTGDSAEKIKEWTGIVSVSAGYGFTLGLKEDGTVVAAGYDHDDQIDVDSWNGITNYQKEWKSIFDKDLRWDGIDFQK